jgi:hypothetical protein
MVDIGGGMHRQQLVLGGRARGDRRQLLAEAGEIEQMLRAADRARAGDVRLRLGEGVHRHRRADHRQPRVVLQIAIVEDQSGTRPYLGHRQLLSRPDPPRPLPGWRHYTR